MSKTLGQAFIDQAKPGCTITKSEVRGLRMRWRLRYRSEREKQASIYKEKEEVMHKGPFVAAPEWQASGLAWWRWHLFCKDGSLRNTRWMVDNFGSRAAEAVNTFERFEVIDFWWPSTSFSGEYGRPFPVIRIVGKNAVYCYVQRGWQSGGNFAY